MGDTHPSATAIVKQGSRDYIYVAKANSDSLGILRLRNKVSDGQNQASNEDDSANLGGVRRLEDFDLSPVELGLEDGHRVHGAYPNALVVSPDNERLYVAEAGINSVAVLDVHHPSEPRLLGRIPTGYPTALAISSDNRFLYISNAKGIGEDINPLIKTDTGNPPPTGLASDSNVDSNFIYGSVQQVDLSAVDLNQDKVLKNNFAINAQSDRSIVPLGAVPLTKDQTCLFHSS